MNPDIFSGTIPALMTPCKADRSPDFDKLVEKAQELVGLGMSAVVYCGSMGDWPLLTNEQRMEGVARLCEAGVPVIVGTGAVNTKIAAAHAAGHDVARLHSGDLSVWSAMGEQLRRLRALNIPYDVTPGVPSFAAAAAALGAELTLPGVAQSVVLTRTSGRASAMPEDETLENFARTGAVLAIHLSVHVLDEVIEKLTPFYGAACPVAVVWRATWPDERIVRATLGSLKTSISAEMERSALILVGRSIGAEDFDESRLYAGDYDRRYRPIGTEPRFPETDPK